jgi:heat shock protein HtpX
MSRFSLSEQIAANKRKAFVLLLGFTAPLLIIGAVIALLLIGPIGLAVVLVLVIGAAAAMYSTSGKAALSISHANPADPQQYARLYNLVEGLCIASGLPMPQLYIIDDDAPNAFSTGLDPKRAAIAVTTGMLEKMNRMELEGVLAHELSHIRNYDILPMTIAVAMARVLILGPLVASVTKFAASPSREYDADASGAQLTRYPPGLISALEKLQGDPTSMKAASKATAHLWIEQPLDDTHPPLDDRIRALQAM